MKRGTLVHVKNAYGDTLDMVVLSPPEPGQDFPVVRVCSPEEFASPDPAGILWPLDAVEALEAA